MKRYESRTAEEHKKNLEDIIANGNIGIITRFPDKTKPNDSNTRVYFAIGPIGDDNIYTLYNAGYTESFSIETHWNKEFKPDGYYANGQFYNCGYNTEFSDNDKISTNTEDIGKIIAEKIIKIISDDLQNEYPTLDSIPSEIINSKDHYFLEDGYVQKEAKEQFLNKNEKTTFLIYLHNPAAFKFTNLKTVIKYRKAIETNSEDTFLQNFKNAIYNIKERNSVLTNKKETFILMLAQFYKLQKALETIHANISSEDNAYHAIREAIEIFMKNNEDAKKVKVFLKGKNNLIDQYTKDRYPNFSVEDKEIQLSTEPATFLHAYQVDGKFNKYRFDIVEPKLKGKFTNHNQDWLENFTASDILRITYRTNIIYQKGNAS